MATKTKTGFGVCCPYCNDADAVVSLDVNDVRKLSCGSCSEEFTIDEVVSKAREMFTRWEKLSRWIDSAAEVGAD